MSVEFGENGIVVDAELICAAFDLTEDEMRALMRTGAMHTVCERGIGEHEGRWRLTFRYDGGMVRLTTDENGRVLSRVRSRAPWKAGKV
ncbi:DUF6522 family protein [Jannaschia aquimarina]|uniref:Uncharacterized protein n=1 Tax=Jannaschia aquimarina TaxID=935700 RepID=A0A0D1EIU5_9RHOB|nr:DUF6522 family protein [Jannaschia aquimarina]KIT15745.1 hypothetical protein jaqu_25390 [Jannaschia aquimarina]SNT43685.1 hypothetical protein SAMN05421775_12319 [Jannaschia aquimarina]